MHANMLEYDKQSAYPYAVSCDITRFYWINVFLITVNIIIFNYALVTNLGYGFIYIHY